MRRRRCGCYKGVAGYEIHPTASNTSAASEFGAAQSLFGRWILLVYCRQQQLQRFASGDDAPSQPEAAIPRELHVGKESGYELRPDDSSSSDPTSDGHGPL